MSEILSIQNLTKKFQSNTVFENLSFSLHKTEMVVLVGRNGAGKTTLAKILLGIDKRYEGQIDKKNKKAVFGYIPQNFVKNNFLPISARSLLSTVAMNATKQYIEHVKEVVDVNDIQDQNVNSLSRGQLQKVLIALSLVNSPNLLVLDEPMQGLDPASIERLYDVVDNIKSKTDTSLLIVSHQVLGFQHSVDRFFVLQDGLKIYSKDQYQNVCQACSHLQ